MLDDHNRCNDDRKAGQRQHAPPPILSWNLPRFSKWRSGPLHHHPPYMHWTRDILDRLLARVFVGKRQLVAHLVVRRARDTDTTRSRETLQPRPDVYPIAIDLLAFDHHVAEVHADAELHPAVGCQIGVFSFEYGLYLDRALDRIHHSGELGQDTVAGGVDESAAVLLDETVD